MWYKKMGAQSDKWMDNESVQRNKKSMESYKEKMWQVDATLVKEFEVVDLGDRECGEG